jgi:hypothetical protein
MANPCVWLIMIGEEAKIAASAVSASLQQYGLTVKGQFWPVGEKQAWLVSSENAALENASLIVIIASKEQYASAAIQRDLAFFRLNLQSKLNRQIDGFICQLDKSDNSKDESKQQLSGTLSILSDWLYVEDGKWYAKAVARLHAPSKSNFPFKIQLYAQEKIGVWMEIRPKNTEIVSGFVFGVSGNSAKISFHAVGISGKLPEKTINEYEFKGMKFETAGLEFEAWGLKNQLQANESYFVKLDGEPDVIAVGSLPNDELEDVNIIYLNH